MSELDLQSLEHVCAWAQAELDREDRRRRMEPLMEAMQQSLQQTSAFTIPDFTAPSTARARLSLIALEKSVAAFPERMQEAEARFDRVLTQAQARTTALRHWLESLS